MRGSIRRFAAILTAVLTVWGTGAAYLHLPVAGGDHGGAASAADADMADCAGCAAEGAGVVPVAPCQAPCMSMVVVVAVGPDPAWTGQDAPARLGEHGKIGRSVAPDPNPPQPSLIG